MITTLASAAAAAAISSASPPTAAAMAPVFSNTIVSTYPDGRQAHLWVSADRTHRATGRRGKPSSGTWSIKGDKVCLRQRKPIGAPFSYCTVMHTPAIGASWMAKAVTGEPIKVTLVRGR